MPRQSDQLFHYIKFRSGEWEKVQTPVVCEAPVSLTVNGELWLTFLCTPIDLEALAAGFLFNEGLIDSKSEIAGLTVCAQGDNVDVWLTHSLEKPAQWRRTSGCSAGATAGLAAIEPFLTPGFQITPSQIETLMEMLHAGQTLYRQARGIHASALVQDGHVLARSEDIGRHNTLDKIAGQVLLGDTLGGQRILLTTGRISSEMLQKGVRLKAAVLISRTSPNALSIETARQAGVTLIGYARRGSFQIYTHPERVTGAPLLGTTGERANIQRDPAR